ncbi:putative proton-coupled zinc antiporter SLC30A3 isoform X2 [Peromyscus maniculatus bairdii]
MARHHCHKNAQAQSGLSPERLRARRQLYAACAVCLIFMAGEVVGGYLAHSLAIMTDAAHLLADVGSMVASLFSLWLSSRPATRTMTFGWHRSETLGALASVISLWMVTGVLLYLAFNRLLHSDYHIEAGAMLLTASIAVCANMLMAFVLHQTGPSHNHGSRGRGMAFVLHQTGPSHSHGSRGRGYAPLEEGQEYPLSLGNTSVRAAFVHVLGDLLQSLGVLVASILIYFKPQYKAADPISTFLFSICALGSTAPTLRDVLRILMEGAPPSMGFEPVRDTLLSVPGVRATHDLHLWALTLTYHVVSAHLAIGTEPPLIALPQTPRLTLKLSWLRPHRGSIPGLDSPAAPCRWSNTSLRWPGVHTARNPPKPELRPTPHPTARPRLSHGLSAPASPSQKGPSSLHLPPAKCPSPRPPWSRPKCVCVCMRGSRGRGGSD